MDDPLWAATTPQQARPSVPDAELDASQRDRASEEAPPGDATPTGVPRLVRRRRWVRRTLWSLLALVLVAVAYYGICLYQVWSTGRSDQARPVDAIVVLGAAQYDGRPSPVLQARLDHALELYLDGMAPLVFVTGGNQPGDRFTEAEASARYLTARGVPASAILRESQGGSTWESLRAVADQLGERGLEDVLLVTDPYHSLRTRLTAQELGLTAYVSPTRTSPVHGSTVIAKEMKEAAGVAVGRIVGFERLFSWTG